MVGARKIRIRSSQSDRIFVGAVYTILSTVFLVAVFPLIYVISASFSSPEAVISGRVWLYPVEPTLIGYTAIFKNPYILAGYGNSLFYAFFGTLINITVTILAAYPLSRREFMPRNFVMAMLVFTMLFSGGLIPIYLLVKSLGMVNTRWAMVIPNAMAVWNVILTRTYFVSAIPDQLHESAELDGCSEFRYVLTMLLPLSKPIIAVIALYYAVGHWNSYFQALIYLQDKSLFPLQIILREILILNSFNPEMMINADELLRKQGLEDLLKYSLIVVATLPVLALYPFIQKYFIKGVMIGSIKG